MTYEYRTPETTLWWATVAQWTEAGWRISRRCLSSARIRAMEAHRGCLRRDVIEAETEIEAIDAALYLLIHGPRVSRPRRGHRAGDPSMPVIVHLSNRRQAFRRGRDEMPAGGNWKAVHGPAII